VTGYLYERTCATMPVHRRLLTRDPAYREARARIENLALDLKLGLRQARVGTFRIPVAVHIVYNTPEQEVSFSQVQSQIDALNRDYRAKAPEIANLPDPWKPLVGDPGIEFVLATTDPAGNATNGVDRRATDVPSFSDNDAVKSVDTGGLAAWPADRYLNLWVCPMRDFLGYAQFPGGPPETDGVVINYQAFGTVGTATAPFSLGRTAVHEIGHWLNLLHIWGDDGLGCSGTDNVDDTPNQAGPNTGIPSYPHVTCDNAPDGDLFVNFMDYTDDAGMVMFTQGQVSRMRAVFDGPRASFEPEPDGEPQPPDGQPVEPQQPAPAGAWQHTDLTAATGAPEAAGEPVAVVAGDGAVQVVYRSADGHIQHLRAGGA
jgi:hypothetical protein